jgi:hypothetical protein
MPRDTADGGRRATATPMSDLLEALAKAFQSKSRLEDGRYALVK